MNSPRKVRSDIQALAKQISQVRTALLEKQGISVAQIGKECRRSADILTELLAKQELPENYKVAVVGRFKTGKSSFVNELLGARLASEDTNPETAAITTFRHGAKVKATITFLTKEEWEKLRALYSEDPKHIDAHRVKMWESFRQAKKGRDANLDESFDLKSLADQYLASTGVKLEVLLEDESSKKSVAEFRKRLKDFTSGAKPHHCLVKTIEIESPAEILEGGVLLIDTPGLDDTERFRVSLTEKTVEDVDAILFLTKSGESYGQSDKDFLLSLLRKGTVKQLIVVITQVDLTYQQHLDNAEASDDEPESIGVRIERERRRLAKELSETLAELGSDDSPAIRSYREQLGEIEIAFTSAKLHRDWCIKKPTICAISEDDPGGVGKLKGQLLRLLSTESRLAVVAKNIAAGASTTLLDLHTVLDTKLLAIRDIKDKEVAEQKLRSFREQFAAASEGFESAVAKELANLDSRIGYFQQQARLYHENISLLAESEISALETSDVGRHWRTRRSGYWGYMSGFQTKVANRIFPKVQELLGQYAGAFSRFADGFEVSLGRLARDASGISASLELNATFHFDVSAKLKEALEKSLASAQELVLSEEQKITSLLDDFVSEEVSEKIDVARTKVSGIWGGGTTGKQSNEVHDFYREVKRLLSAALMNHLAAREEQYCTYLKCEAQKAPIDALGEVRILLEQADDNIRAATTAQVAGQKQEAEDTVAEIKANHATALGAAETLLSDLEIAHGESMKVGELPSTLVEIDTGFAPEVPVAQPVLMPTSEVVVSAVVPSAGAFAEDAGGAGGISASDTTPLDSTGSSEPLAPSSQTRFEGDDWFDRVQEEATVVVQRLRLRDGKTNWAISRVFDAALLAGAQRVVLIDPYLANPHQTRNLREFLLHVAETARPREIRVLTGFATPDKQERFEIFLENAAQDLFQNHGVQLSWVREVGLHDRFLLLDTGILFKLGRGLDMYKPATGLAEHRASSRRVRETEIDVFCVPTCPLARGSRASA